MTKSASKVAARKTRKADPKTASKGRGKAGNKYRKPAAKVAEEMVRDTHRKTTALFEQFPIAQVPDTFRVLAERNVAHTRELYERSKNTLQAVLKSWQQSFGAAGQGVVALNVKMIDVAERNINASFDLATNLAGARNLAEVMELQATYWRNLFGELRPPQVGRALSSKGRVHALTSL
jgi:hypothetical protein